MLSQLLTAEVFSFLLVFCRVGAVIMLMPGIGESYVSPRIRLMLALTFSLVLLPVLQGLPKPPTELAGLLVVVLSEIGTGLFIGVLARMVISGVHVAGGIIAYQSSLSSALTNNVSGFTGQDTTVGNLLGMTALTLLFTTDLHHVMLRSIMDSYTLFLPGELPLTEDMAKHMTQTVSSTFRIAMQLAAPHLVVGMMLYLGAGIIARLMPNLQIFFIMMPAQLLTSFFVMLVTLGAIMLWYLEYLHGAMGAFMVPV